MPIRQTFNMQRSQIDEILKEKSAHIHKGRDLYEAGDTKSALKHFIAAMEKLNSVINDIKGEKAISIYNWEHGVISRTIQTLSILHADCGSPYIRKVLDEVLVLKADANKLDEAGDTISALQRYITAVEKLNSVINDIKGEETLSRYKWELTGMTERIKILRERNDCVPSQV